MSSFYGRDYPEPVDPDGGPGILPPPDQPMAVARMLLPEWQRDGLLTLRRWRGTWVRWVGTHWTDVDDSKIRATLYERTEHALFAKGNKVEPGAPNHHKIRNLLEALDAITYTSTDIDPPTWLDGRTTGPIVSCENGLLEISTRRLHEHTPLYFTPITVPFAYDPHAPTPERWLSTSWALWPNSTGLPSRPLAMGERRGRAG